MGQHGPIWVGVWNDGGSVFGGALPTVGRSGCMAVPRSDIANVPHFVQRFIFFNASKSSKSRVFAKPDSAYASVRGQPVSSSAAIGCTWAPLPRIFPRSGSSACSPGNFVLFCKALALFIANLGFASMAKATFIIEKDLTRLFKVATVTGDNPVRNTALILVLYGTGMKLTEIARLPINRLLSAKGEFLEDSEVPAEIAYNGKARPLHWTNTKLISALEKYLEFRIRHRHAVTTRTGAYRSLDPDSPIFLTETGTPFKMVKRKTRKGAISYSCDTVGDTIKELHQKAGIEGATAESCRRTFAVRLHQKGFDLRHINELLGHETLKATKNLIDQDPVRLGAIVAGVI